MKGTEMNMEDLEIEKRLTTVEEKVKQHGETIHELKNITNEIHTMSGAIIKLTEQSKNTNEDVKEIKTKVSVLETEPKTKWDTVVKTVITALISGLIAIAVTILFKG